MCRAVKKADKEDKTKLLNKVDAFIFDCMVRTVKDAIMCILQPSHKALQATTMQSHITMLVTCRRDLEGRQSH